MPSAAVEYQYLIKRADGTTAWLGPRRTLPPASSDGLADDGELEPAVSQAGSPPEPLRLPTIGEADGRRGSRDDEPVRRAASESPGLPHAPPPREPWLTTRH